MTRPACCNAELTASSLVIIFKHPVSPAVQSMLSPTEESHTDRETE